MATEMYFRNICFNPIDNIDGFIFVSKFSESKHIEFNSRFMQTQNLQIYNFTQGEDSCIVRKGQYYLYYGRLSEEKGLFTLIKTFKEKKQLSLCIVGTGPIEPEIKDLISRENIENIKMLGFKSGETLNEIIKNAKCVIVPSECYENNPMTIIESYSYSTPVIGAYIGGVPEIIIDGETGYVFESGNCQSLSNAVDKFEEISDEDYVKYSQNAFKFYCDNFHMGSYYKRLIQFYEQVICNYHKK